MRHRLPALLLLSLTACGPTGVELGELRLIPSTSGFSLSPRQGGPALLESVPFAEGSYAPVAVRKGRARVEMQYGAFRFTEGPGEWELGSRLEVSSQGKERMSATFRAGSGKPVATLTAEVKGEGALALTVRAADEEVNRLALAFRCEAVDRFLGFGAQADGLDHRGHKIPIWTSEPGIGKSESDEPGDLWFLQGTRHASSYGLPTWLSPRGYVAVVESDRRSVFELCSAREDAFRLEVWSNELTLWVFFGPEPARALERATAHVLGRPPRPPPLAFAPWHDAIYGEANVRQVAQLIRAHQLPSSAIWTEDFRGGQDVSGQGYRLIEEWDVDRSLYPAPKALSADLHRQGFAWFAYFNTFVVQGTRVWAEAERGGHLVRSPEGGPYLFSGVTFKPTGLADLSRPQTARWVQGYLEAAIDEGFDGWMTDYGEWLPHDALLASGEDAQAAHNRYPLEWVKLNQEALRAREGDGRQRLFFARAGWLGSTRHTPVVWAGDQRTSFQRDDGLYTVIPMGLGLGLGGVSTFGHDIAGYQSVGNPPSSRELFFRWTSLGALSPVMRTHHGLFARENWWFGKDAETIAHFRRWASLHVRLFPYLDAGSAQAEAAGLPLMRALPLAHPEDAAGWAVSDQYLLGPDLLVAPVVDEGKSARMVHFPPGRWVPLFGGAPVEGPADLEVAAPVTELPVFARAGAVLPLLPEGVQTLLPAEPPVVDLDDVASQRELWLFGGGGGSFEERDGTRYVVTLGGAEAPHEAGAALPACGGPNQRGCVEQVGAGRRIRLAGQGPLEASGQRLEVQGPPRRLDVWLR